MRGPISIGAVRGASGANPLCSQALSYATQPAIEWVCCCGCMKPMSCRSSGEASKDRIKLVLVTTMWRSGADSTTAQCQRDRDTPHRHSADSVRPRLPRKHTITAGRGVRQCAPTPASKTHQISAGRGVTSTLEWTEFADFLFVTSSTIASCFERITSNTSHWSIRALLNDCLYLDLSGFITKNILHSSCEIEYFVETQKIC